MKHIAVVFALAATLGCGVLYGQSKDTSITMRWNSFDVGLEKAKANHKKVLVDVYTEWCGWCAKMDSEVYTEPGYQRLSVEEFRRYQNECRREPTRSTTKARSICQAQLAAAFGVNRLPFNALFAR